MSLLASFKMAGLIGSTEQAWTLSESKVLDAVTWERERPQSLIYMPDTINSSYVDNELSLNCSIVTFSYASAPNVYGSSYMSFMINITASFASGFATDLNVTFVEDYPSSFVGLRLEPPYFYFLGLTNMALTGYGSHSGGSLKAYAQFASVGEPRTLNVWIDGIDWFFQSPENRSHSMEADISLRYYNGSTYKGILQPFLLKMIGHSNDDFGNAMEIHGGNYSKLYLDPVDYYKISANAGQTIRIYVYADQSVPINPTARFEINVYDRGLSVILHQDETYSNIIEFTSNSTSYCYIKLERYMAGFYSMEVNA